MMQRELTPEQRVMVADVYETCALITQKFALLALRGRDETLQENEKQALEEMYEKEVTELLEILEAELHACQDNDVERGRLVHLLSHCLPKEIFDSAVVL